MLIKNLEQQNNNGHSESPIFSCCLQKNLKKSVETKKIGYQSYLYTSKFEKLNFRD